MSEKEEEVATPSQIRDLENGIFNLSVTLAQTLSATGNKHEARLYVASYLERIATALKDMQETTGESND